MGSTLHSHMIGRDGPYYRQRSNSGLSASSSSSSYTSTSPNFKVSHFDFLDMFVARFGVGQVFAVKSSWCQERFHRKLRFFELDSEVRLSKIDRSLKSARSIARALRVNSVQDSEKCTEPEITASLVQRPSIWDQCIRLVQTEGSTEEDEVDSWISTRVMSRNSHAGFAAISAQRRRAPPLPAKRRSKLPQYATGGIILSIAALAIWQAIRTESYSREQLISRDQSSVTSTPQRVDSAFERAKASVAQAACVNRAVAAIRNNNFMECTIEMELALEENRLARTSIESDFYEEEEILQVYQGVIKMWTDGYPLDYGKVLQLRNLLDLTSQKAEALEDEVMQQSDAYVI
ncbi:unnamed protein product [Calypogeia fissa]